MLTTQSVATPNLSQKAPTLAAGPSVSEILGPWAEAPRWGGSWKEFFEHFRASGGNTLTFVNRMIEITHGVGHTPSVRAAIDQAVKSEYYDPQRFKYVPVAPLLMKLEQVPGEIGPDRFALNGDSPVLQLLLRGGVDLSDSGALLPKADRKADVLEFLNRSLDGTARKLGFENGAIITGATLATLLTEPLSLRDIYTSGKLLPVDESLLTPRTREFMDRILADGVNSGLLEEFERPGFSGKFFGITEDAQETVRYFISEFGQTQAQALHSEAPAQPALLQKETVG